MCVHVRAVYSESIKDVTVNAKNNFGGYAGRQV